MNKYLALAIPTIAEIHSRGKLPIVVGGTNYYIEGLLFEKSHLTEEVDWEAFGINMDKLSEELPQTFTPLLKDLRDAIPQDNKAFIE